MKKKLSQIATIQKPRKIPGLCLQNHMNEKISNQGSV